MSLPTNFFIGRGSGGAAAIWDSTTVNAVFGSYSGISTSIESETMLRIQANTEPGSGHNDDSNTATASNTAVVLTGVDLAQLGHSLGIGFYGIGAGGGGQLGPCTNSGGGGGGAFRMVVNGGFSQLSSTLIRIGRGGRGAFQGPARSGLDEPYGVLSLAFNGGDTRIGMANIEAYAYGGESGEKDSCVPLTGGGSNTGGGGAYAINHGGVGTSALISSGGYTGGDSINNTGHAGCGGGNGASPVGGDGLTHYSDSNKVNSAGDGTIGEGGYGATRTTRSSSFTNSTITFQDNHFILKGHTGGGGGGSIETDGGGNTLSYDYAGHGGNGLLWIELQAA